MSAENGGQTQGPARAMVLAAGMGNRMRPLTDDRPKPLVEVAGKALIDYNLDRLAEAGVETAVVNLHYRADQLQAHLKSRTRPRILFSDERAALLDSGGGVRRALPLLGDGPFYCLNADTIWLDGPRLNLARLGEAFDPTLMDMLLLVSATTTAVGWGNRGDFVMDQFGRLTRPGHGLVTPFLYTGVAVMTPALFKDAPEVFSLNLLFDRAIMRERLFGLRLDGIWMHVGTPDAVIEAEQALRLSRF